MHNLWKETVFFYFYFFYSLTPHDVITGSLNTRWHNIQNSFDDGSSTNNTTAWSAKKQKFDEYRWILLKVDHWIMYHNSRIFITLTLAIMVYGDWEIIPCSTKLISIHSVRSFFRPFSFSFHLVFYIFEVFLIKQSCHSRSLNINLI